MDTDDRSDAQAAIVDVLRDGRATTGYLAAETGYSNAHINTHLRVLLATDVIRTVHEPTALHELSNGPHPARDITVDIDTLSAPEAAIVEGLRKGRATTGYLADNVEYSRSHINTHLRLLLAKGITRKVHPSTALYELIENTRKTPTDATESENETTETHDTDRTETH